MCWVFLADKKLVCTLASVNNKLYLILEISSEDALPLFCFLFLLHLPKCEPSSVLPPQAFPLLVLSSMTSPSGMSVSPSFPLSKSVKLPSVFLYPA